MQSTQEEHHLRRNSEVRQVFFSFIYVAFWDNIPGSANGLFGANVLPDSLFSDFWSESPRKSFGANVLLDWRFSEFLLESPRNLSFMLPRNDDLLMV